MIFEYLLTVLNVFQENSYYILPTVVLCIFLLTAITALLMGRRYSKKISMLQNTYERGIAQEKELAARVAGRLEETQKRNIELETNLAAFAKHNDELSTRLADIKARAEEQKQSVEAEMERVIGLRHSLVSEFENLVSRHFQTQQKQFGETSQDRISQVLNPLQRQLTEFRSRVDEIHKNDIAQTHQMLGQVQQLQMQAQKIGSDAVQLARALRGSSKLRGNWGEWVLRRLFEQTGLQEGREFTLQAAHIDDEGRRQQPDALVLLPGDRQVVVDSKLSLVAYEAWSAAEPDEEVMHMKKHIDSVRQHIKSLGKKRYDTLPNVNCLDYVVMFVPIESAFIVAIEGEPTLLSEAASMRVVLAGPSNLMAILQTMESLWQRDRQDRNVEQIVQEAGKLHDQFTLFLESMQTVSSALDKARVAHDQALSRLTDGKGNVVRRVNGLRELGARTRKQIPADLIEASEV